MLYCLIIHERPQPITFITEPRQRRGDKFDWLTARGQYETIQHGLSFFISILMMTQPGVVSAKYNQLKPVYRFSENVSLQVGVAYR